MGAGPCAHHPAAAFGLPFYGRDRDDGDQPPAAATSRAGRQRRCPPDAVPARRTDRPLGVILLGSNLVNTVLATLITAPAIHHFGQNEWVLAIAAGSPTFALLIFAEVTPKVIAATSRERVALPAGFVLAVLLKLATPLVWFVNLFVGAVLRITAHPSAQQRRCG